MIKSPQAASSIAYSWGLALVEGSKEASWIMRSAKLPTWKMGTDQTHTTGVALLSIHVPGQEDRQPQTTWSPTVSLPLPSIKSF